MGFCVWRLGVSAEFEGHGFVQSTQMGVSENRGTLFGGPYNKDPTI